MNTPDDTVPQPPDGFFDNEARVRKAVADLGEHFETVRIFVSVHHPGSTTSNTETHTYGSGNAYAQFGQVLTWVDDWKDGPAHDFSEFEGAADGCDDCGNEGGQP